MNSFKRFLKPLIGVSFLFLSIQARASIYYEVVQDTTNAKAHETLVGDITVKPYVNANKSIFLDGPNRSFSVLNSTVTDAALFVSTNGTSSGSIIYVSSGGNVGIGTASPTSKLMVVNGDIKISTNTGNRGFIFQDGSTLYSALISSLAVNSVYPAAVSAGTYGNITLPAANVASGTLGASVIVSSLAVNSVYPASVSAGTYSNITLPGANVSGNISGNAANITGNLAATQVAAGTLSSSVIVASLAVNSVYTNSIQSQAVGATQVANNTLTNGQMAAGTFSNISIPAANVNTGTLGSSVIASSHAVSSVYTNSIVNNAVTAAQVANNTLTDSQMANGTFTNVKVPAANVNSGTLGGSVIASSIAASGVVSGTYGSASFIPALTIGADGRVTSASSSTFTGSQWTTVGTAIAYNTGAVGIGTLAPSAMFHFVSTDTTSSYAVIFQAQNGPFGLPVYNFASTSAASGLSLALSTGIASNGSQILGLINGEYTNNKRIVAFGGAQGQSDTVTINIDDHYLAVGNSRFPTYAVDVAGDINSTSSYRINGQIAFSSTPTFTTCSPLQSALANGTTFISFVPVSAITLLRVDVVIDVAGAGGSGNSTWSCGKTGGGAGVLAATVAVDAASGTTANATGSIAVASGTAIKCYLNTNETTRPGAGVCLQYAMQ